MSHFISSTLFRRTPRVPAKAFSELSVVKLRQSATIEGIDLSKGDEGTIVLCHGNEAYEIEFAQYDTVVCVSATLIEVV
jgi:hypothetical protein